MKYNDEWVDFEVISTSKGEKLEKWGNYILLRPDPQVIWDNGQNLRNYKGLSAHYHRKQTGGGYWEYLSKIKEEWTLNWRNLTFCIKPMGFKHTGLFPEQAVNWDMMISAIKNSNRPINVLNLFGYTGGATVACASAGASVTHVDASKNMVDRCKQNITMSGLENASVRYIVDDCKKYVEREIRRGKKYDAIIMDPPSYGRGPSGEMWKIEESLFDFVKLCKEVLSDNPLFVLINSYTTGLQPLVLKNILSIIFGADNVEAYEVGLKAKDNVTLPCGASGVKKW